MSTDRPAPLGPILALSFLATFGTAVLWNGLAFIAREGYGFDEIRSLVLAIWNGGIYASSGDSGCARWWRSCFFSRSPSVPSC